jgi:methylated-DNA-protein-cysteine methyltransferase-like protein
MKAKGNVSKKIKKSAAPGGIKTSIEGKGPRESGYSFFEDVYDVVRQVPKGRVTSYGAIAAYLGTKLSARMVGWAMNAARLARPKVPAHRVVNRNGMLSGKHHFTTPTEMEELLRKEKIEVKNDSILDFEKLFWNPAEELTL